MAAFYGMSGGAIAGRERFNEEMRLAEDKRDRAIERDARKDQIATNKVNNEQSRRTASHKGDAVIAKSLADIATEHERETSAAIKGRRTRSDAQLAINTNASKNRQIDSSERAAITGNEADIANNEQSKKTAASKGRADRAENSNRAVEAGVRNRTAEGRVLATNWESQNRQRQAELKAEVASLDLDSGVNEVEARMRKGEAIRKFLGEVYETSRTNGPRAADLINNFDLDDDGQPDIQGAVDVVTENGEIKVLGADGKPVIDGSTGAPAVYKESDFKKMVEDKQKPVKSSSSSSSASTTALDKDPNKYSTKTRQVVSDAVMANSGLGADATPGVDEQKEIDLIAGIVDESMTGDDKLTMNQAMSKYGSKAKLIESAGYTTDQLADAAAKMGISEIEVLTRVLKKANQ